MLDASLCALSSLLRTSPVLFLIRSLFLSLACAVALGIGFPPTAHAQTDPSEDYDPKARATEHYEAAAQAYGEGNFERAADLLERAYANDSDLIYKYNEILARMGLGQYDQALRILDTYYEPMDADDRFDDLPQLHAELQGAQAATDVWSWAAESNDAPEPTPRDDDTVLSEPPSISDDADGDASKNVMAWTLLGTGAGLLTGGGLVSSGLFMQDAMDRLNAWADGDDVYSDTEFSYDADQDTLRSHKILSGVLLATGVGAAATGVTLLFLNRPSRPDQDVQTDLELRLVPIVDDHRRGAGLSGRF